MDDHIAVSPNPAQAPSERETDSGLEEADTYERVGKETDDSDNQIIDVVATSESDQEGTIIVDPTTMEEGVQALAREVDDSAVKDVREVSNENNNNQVVEKVMLELQTNRPQTSRQPSQQLLLHQVPIRFPVPSNLMESVDSLMFINDALISLIDDLPSDVLIDASPLHRVSSQQARAAVVLTFNTEQMRNWVLKAFREHRANNSITGEVY